MSTIEERDAVMQSMTNDEAHKAGLELFDIVGSQVEGIQSPDVWINDDQEISVKLTASEWFAVLTDILVSGVYYHEQGHGRLVYDSAKIMGQVADQLAEAKQPATV